jgi:hypothetical protein
VLRGARAEQAGPTEDGWVLLWWLRIRGSPRFEQLAAAQMWDPAALLVAAGGAPPGRSALPTLIGAPDSAALIELASAVMTTRADDAAVACAAVRLLEPRVWVEKGHTETYLASCSPHWDVALAAVGPDRVHPDFAVRLLTLAALAAIAGQPYPEGCTAMAADPALAAHAAAQVVALVDEHVVFAPAVLAASLVRTSTDEQPAAPVGGVGQVLARAAQHLAVTRVFTEQEVDDAAGLMVAMSGAEPDGSSLRRNRKLVGKMLERGAEAQPSLVARTEGHR